VSLPSTECVQLESETSADELALDLDIVVISLLCYYTHIYLQSVNILSIFLLFFFSPLAIFMGGYRVPLALFVSGF